MATPATDRLREFGWYGLDGRGLALEGLNTLTISDDLRTLNLTVNALDDQVVQLRVLTVPEPDSGLLVPWCVVTANIRTRARSRASAGYFTRP